MRVLYMSGYHATRGCRGIEHGGNFIRKPFDLDQLGGMVGGLSGPALARKVAGHTSGVAVAVRRIFDPEKRGFGAYAA